MYDEKKMPKSVGAFYDAITAYPPKFERDSTDPNRYVFDCTKAAVELLHPHMPSAKQKTLTAAAHFWIGQMALFAYDVASSYITSRVMAEGHHEGRGIPGAYWSTEYTI